MAEDHGSKIEKGVPLPRPTRKHPWADMEPGDSFLLPCEPAERERVGNRARNAAASFAEKRGWTGSSGIRSVEGGMRIWRVK